MNNTYSGDGYMRVVHSKELIHLTNPEPSQIHIVDIAAGLAKICRFNGQINTFYSVAEHSVRVSQDVPDDWKLEALMHDATEAYIQDIIRPIKYLPIMVEYRKLEAIWEQAIVERFELQYPFDESIKRSDNGTQEWERGQMKLSNSYEGMPWQKAEKYFMAAFIQYVNQRGKYETFRADGRIKDPITDLFRTES